NPTPVYLLVNGPAGMAVDYFTGAITWTPQGLKQIGAVPVTIRATNYAGFADDNFTITVTNPRPAAPANLHVVSATEDTVTISWSPEDPVAGAVTYGIFIPHPWHDPRGSGGGINYEPIGSTPLTSVTIMGLKANTSYTFDV